MTAGLRNLAAVMSCALLPLLFPNFSFGQGRQPVTETVRVNGKSMRVVSSVTNERRPGQPVLVLEAGANSTSGAWRPVLNRLSQLAPVVAYDRSGLGQSEFDGVPPTLHHVAEVLHALLAESHVPPPYVLVGHSWGMAYVRAFANAYPNEVVGIVFIEATDFERTPEEERAELPPGSAGGVGPTLPEGPPGMRAEFDQLLAEGSRGFATLRAMALPTALPVATVVGMALPDDMPADQRRTMTVFKRLQLKHQTTWTLASLSGLLLVSSESGHYVMGDAPDLVIQAVQHVLAHVGKGKQ